MIKEKPACCKITLIHLRISDTTLCRGMETGILRFEAAGFVGYGLLVAEGAVNFVDFAAVIETVQRSEDVGFVVVVAAAADDGDDGDDGDDDADMTAHDDRERIGNSVRSMAGRLNYL